MKEVLPQNIRNIIINDDDNFGTDLCNTIQIPRKRR